MIECSITGRCIKQSQSELQFEGRLLGQVQIGDELEVIQNQFVLGTIVTDRILRNGHDTHQAQSGQFLELITWTPISFHFDHSSVLLETPQHR